MKVNKCIASIMKEKKVTQAIMAAALGLNGANRVGRRLMRENMNTDSVIEMLGVLGYELVIQPIKPGKRPDGQIVLEMSDDKEDAK